MMSSRDPCACKGIRTCIVCEETKIFKTQERDTKQKTFIYCSHCQKAWKEDSSASDNNNHPDHEGDWLHFPGVTLLYDFVTEDEEKYLCHEIDKAKWVESQSGRRKQDYGPKVNFKKRKLKSDVFTGLPSFSKFLVTRMQERMVLSDFNPIELCNLEYCPEKGSAIDPHFDDFWVWGSRLVTLNLLSDTKHTMTVDSDPDVEVIIPLPARSLVVVQGPARYEWKHGIKRGDIKSRRLAITFRELSSEFQQGGMNEHVGTELLEIANTFNGLAVGSNGV